MGRVKGGRERGREGRRMWLREKKKSGLEEVLMGEEKVIVSTERVILVLEGLDRSWDILQEGDNILRPLVRIGHWVLWQTVERKA